MPNSFICDDIGSPYLSTVHKNRGILRHFAHSTPTSVGVESDAIGYATMDIGYVIDLRPCTCRFSV